ncbi:Dabb family protein [Methanobacterium sp. ACI-7]|uniref:Dabb family protein n=1 Tax=unclassified Methanobacterium TaxID=2627676 RepID=UPI0039C00D40
MIIHIVMFKLNDNGEESAKKAKDMLLSLEGKIEELKHIEVGRDITHSDRSYDMVLLTKFESVEGLKSYQVNPLHVEVAEYLVSASESIIAVDYESS